jgi:hypothetical protein
MISMLSRIELRFELAKDAERIMKSVTPDNFPLPNGLHIETSIDDNHLIFEISCNRGLDSLAATIEDLLSAIDLSIRTLDSISS